MKDKILNAITALLFGLLLGWALLDAIANNMW